MTPRWIQLISQTEEFNSTYGMNVPGGCLIMVDTGASPVFVPGVKIVESEDKPIELVSTVTEDVEKALEPIQTILRMLAGVQGISPIKLD